MTEKEIKVAVSTIEALLTADKHTDKEVKAVIVQVAKIAAQFFVDIHRIAHAAEVSRTS